MAVTVACGGFFWNRSPADKGDISSFWQHLAKRFPGPHRQRRGVHSASDPSFLPETKVDAHPDVGASCLAGGA